jgi:hypothetical protein
LNSAGPYGFTTLSLTQPGAEHDMQLPTRALTQEVFEMLSYTETLLEVVNLLSTI